MSPPPHFRLQGQGLALFIWSSASRLLNDEGSPNLESPMLCAHQGGLESTLEFRHSFVIPHAGLVIPSSLRYFPPHDHSSDLAHDAGAGTEGPGLDTHVMQQAHKEVGEQGVVLRVVGEVALVLETSPGEQDGQVVVVV